MIVADAEEQRCLESIVINLAFHAGHTMAASKASCFTLCITSYPLTKMTIKERHLKYPSIPERSALQLTHVTEDGRGLKPDANTATEEEEEEESCRNRSSTFCEMLRVVNNRLKRLVGLI